MTHKRYAFILILALLVISLVIAAFIDIQNKGMSLEFVRKGDGDYYLILVSRIERGDSCWNLANDIKIQNQHIDIRISGIEREKGEGNLCTFSVQPVSTSFNLGNLQGEYILKIKNGIWTDTYLLNFTGNIIDINSRWTPLSKCVDQINNCI